MNLKNLKIATQLKLGIAPLLLFFIVLGIVAHFQADRMYRQTEIIFNHPFKVQQAIGSLNSDILNTRVGEALYGE